MNDNRGHHLWPHQLQQSRWSASSSRQRFRPTGGKSSNRVFLPLKVCRLEPQFGQLQDRSVISAVKVIVLPVYVED
jgi:hypothetical protein